MEIGIAGAGLMGRLMAWQCLRAGHQVSLYDPDTIAGEHCAGRVAAAMLAPYSEVVSSERQVFDWGLQAMALWPALLDELAHDSGREVDFQCRGSLVVAHAADQAKLQRFNQLLRSRIPDQLDDIEFIQGERLHKLEPALAERFDQATFLSREACLDNWALLDNLAIAIQSLGAQWHSGVAVDEVVAGALLVGGKRLEFDRVIDTRGLAAKSQRRDLRGVRGEVLWVQAPAVAISRPVRLMHPRYQLYIAPKPDQRYVIGATEIESESMAPITVRSSLELQSALYSVDAGFAEASILKAYAHCRPAFSDNLPRIEIEETQISINGLYRHGYLLSPLMLELALANLEGDRPHPAVMRSRPPQLNFA